MTPDELCERLLDFAARIGKLIEKIPDTRLGRHVAGQLVRCGTAGPPNYEEACAAESRADFVHKLKIVLKESRETRSWLRYLVRTELISEGRLRNLIEESTQLCNIIGKSIITAKNIPPTKPDPESSNDLTP